MKYSIPVSIAMPCYNCEEYICSAIQSILNQSFSGFELIIVDDGSTDGSIRIIEAFSDRRIKLILLAENKGNYSARNLGIEAANGKYICMMDADDISLPHRLKTQVEYMETHTYIGGIGTRSEMIDAEGRKIGFINRPLRYAELKVAFLKDTFVTQSTLMIRGWLLRKRNLWYDESFKYTGDYDFVARLAQQFPICNLNEVLVQYRVHSSQISRTKNVEQASSADRVRLGLLRLLKIFPIATERELHLKLMRGLRFTRDELQPATNWLNKILKANQKEKIYNQKALWAFISELQKVICLKGIVNITI